MTGFKKYILDNHPDPDTLLSVDNYSFEQMCRLAEGYSLDSVKNLNIDDVRKFVICDHCKDLGRKYAGVMLGHTKCPKCGKH